MALRIHPRVAWQMVGEEAVLLDLSTGRAIGLNATGSFLWPRLEACPASDLAAALAAEFDVDRTQAQQDVDRFVALLGEKGFIET
jgi:hypothetical protein